MGATTIWYRNVDNDDDSYRFSLPHDGSLKIDERSAQLCADDYHSNHDGWEITWPRDFALYETEDGLEVARFSIEREVEPRFYARRQTASGANGKSSGDPSD